MFTNVVSDFVASKIYRPQATFFLVSDLLKLVYHGKAVFYDDRLLTEKLNLFIRLET